jgi:pre-rRNA-processing protein TSR4
MDDDSGGWGDVDDVDGWDQSSYVAVQTTTSMDDLETSLKGCELQSNQEKLSGLNAKINQHSNEKHNNNNISAPSFVHYELEMINEPVGKTQNDSSDEEDGDDELGASYNIDASKVDSMLSRYLDMEEDKEIIAALKGGKNVSANICGGESGGGERYERLKPEEKAFLTFSKRLRRAPTQVCRYAYGGEPLWSIPLPPKTNFNGGSKQQKPKKNTITTAPFPIIPPCSCGSERVFEFQLLPSLLHTLDVDAANSNKDDEIDKTDLTLMGGMNWGSIAVYSCPESCDESREEFLIVQESGEDVMTKQVSEKMSEDEDCNGA